MSDPWVLLLQPNVAPAWRKLAWRMMRQFADPQQLQSEFGLPLNWLWSVTRQDTAPDAAATKLLLATADAATRCETVVLFPPGPAQLSGPIARKRPRATVCVSSQPGCGVGCPFCATGSLGYRGNLTTAQIVEQVYWAGIVAQQRGRQLRNVVFMGMGEPLHNVSAVIPAIEYLISPSGAGFSPRHITLSTAGVPHAMLEVGKRFPRLRIALSLHSADAAQRRQLVPRAVGDLELLKQTLAELNAIQQQAVWIEMVLFDQTNDSLEHARLLANFCQGLQVEINLIPYNSAGQPSQYLPSPQWRREAFARVLRESGLRTTIRTSLGAEVGAACGQLTATP